MCDVIVNYIDTFAIDLLSVSLQVFFSSAFYFRFRNSCFFMHYRSRVSSIACEDPRDRVSRNEKNFRLLSSSSCRFLLGTESFATISARWSYEYLSARHWPRPNCLSSKLKPNVIKIHFLIHRETTNSGGKLEKREKKFRGDGKRSEKQLAMHT